MSKWSKRLLSLAAIGGAAAGLAYYLKKSDSCSEDDFVDETEDEDFDLDNDLKPVSDREYVPLNTVSRSKILPRQQKMLSKTLLKILLTQRKTLLNM